MDSILGIVTIVSDIFSSWHWVAVVVAVLWWLVAVRPTNRRPDVADQIRPHPRMVLSLSILQGRFCRLIYDTSCMLPGDSSRRR